MGGCLAGIGVATWFGLAATLGRVTWVDLGFRVVDDRTVEVTYDVYAPADRDVTCVVRALDQQFGTVGALEVRIPAGSQDTARRTDRVRTTARAVTGVVKSCTAH